jgi:A/G-specific adenine glycosylase
MLSATERQDLEHWYAQVARPLPWRKSQPDAYEVWIAEVMSQQSTMASVVPYWQRWMLRFPNLLELARASESEVLSQWSGLGYYSRARNIHRAAQQLVSRPLPRSWLEWIELPGVGEYTAKAVSASCFGEAVLPVDGNVLRWVSRHQGIRNPLNSRDDRRQIESAVDSLAATLPASAHSTWVHLVMELGSQLCKPVNPRCNDCPLQNSCVSFGRHGDKAQIPIAKLRAQPKRVQSVQLVFWKGGAPLLRLRPPGARLENQWELPSWELQTQDPKLETILSKFKLLARSAHAITRYRYELVAIDAGPWRGKVPRGYRPYHKLDSDCVVTTASRKILEQLSF